MCMCVCVGMPVCIQLTRACVLQARDLAHSLDDFDDERGHNHGDSFPMPPSPYPGQDLVMMRPDLIAFQRQQRQQQQQPPLAAEDPFASSPPWQQQPPPPPPHHEAAAGGDDDDDLAAALEASRKEAAAMQQLGALFGLMPQRELRAVLERQRWDVNAAACELIEIGMHY